MGRSSAPRAGINICLKLLTCFFPRASLIQHGSRIPNGRQCSVDLQQRESKSNSGWGVLQRDAYAHWLFSEALRPSIWGNAASTLRIECEMDGREYAKSNWPINVLTALWKLHLQLNSCAPWDWVLLFLSTVRKSKDCLGSMFGTASLR